jgi:stress-induced morphogen
MLAGGCGAMYRITVVSPKFEGVPLVKRHRLVHRALQSEIGAMHGFTLNTLAPDQWQQQSAVTQE